MMSVTDPRLFRYLATAKAAGLEVAGFEVGPRLIKVQMRESVGAGEQKPDKFADFLATQRAKGSKPPAAKVDAKARGAK
jgi:hypothetical protein